MVDQLHKQIIDLQEKLTELTPPGNKRSTKSTLTAKYHFQDITHVSTAMHDIITHCKQAAKSDSSVMIYGETGTGKELIAQSLHNAQQAGKRPLPGHQLRRPAGASAGEPSVRYGAWLIYGSGIPGRPFRAGQPRHPSAG